ncbi:hypothetical protein DYQ86_15935 [Acidobacteria bacterium AB60]|nr:hypothetical protein DYQ86_15935 [Acidobacteria bacterium AB60]
MESQTARFEGWALVELMGHQREAGYVTTQYFGDKAMFQIDVPEIPAGQETLTQPKWGDAGMMQPGTVIEREAVPGRTRIVNPAAVYALNPATEEAVRAAVSASERRTIKVLSLPTKGDLPLLPGEGMPDDAKE